MFGISETVRRNLTVLPAEREGAYTARAIEICARLTPDQTQTVVTHGLVPQTVMDEARAAGFDDFILAKRVRDHLTAGR